MGFYKGIYMYILIYQRLCSMQNEATLNSVIFFWSFIFYWSSLQNVKYTIMFIRPLLHVIIHFCYWC